MYIYTLYVVIFVDTTVSVCGTAQICELNSQSFKCHTDAFLYFSPLTKDPLGMIFFD